MFAKIGAAVALALLAVAILFGLRSFIEHREIRRVDANRARMLDGFVMAAELWGKADALVLGDSLLAGSPIDCGKVFTMTIPTVTATEMLHRGRRVADRVKPQVVIISLGTNDAYWKETAPILEEVRQWPEKVLWIAPARAPEAAARIERIARDRGEWIYRYNGRTTDGIHPDLAGRQAIRTAVSQRCEAAISPSSTGT